MNGNFKALILTAIIYVAVPFARVEEYKNPVVLVFSISVYAMMYAAFAWGFERTSLNNPEKRS